MSLQSFLPLDPGKYAGNGDTVCPDPVSSPVLMLHDDFYGQFLAGLRI